MMLNVLLSCEKACEKNLPKNSKKMFCDIIYFLVGEGVMTSRNSLIGFIFVVYCT